MKPIPSRPLLIVMAPAIALCLGILSGCSDSSPETLLAAAKQSLAKRDSRTATVQIKEALEVIPDSPEARFLLGDALLESGDAKSAELELRKAATLQHPADAVVPKLATAMLLQGQYAKVIGEFAGSQLQAPAAASALQATLAVAYSNLGQTEQSNAALAEARRLDPDNVTALILDSRQKAESRQIDAAFALADSALTKEPANPEAWKLKGDLLLATKDDMDGAMAAYQKSVDVKPDFQPGHASILTILLHRGQTDKAVTQLAKMKQAAGGSARTKYFEARVAFRQRDFRAAKEATDLLLQSASDDPVVLEIAGAAEFQLGALEIAEAHLKKALQRSPQLGLARRFLVMTYLRMAQPGKALEAMLGNSGKAGIAPQMFSLAGRVYLENGDLATADEFFSKAAKLSPSDAKNRTALALTHMLKGEAALGLRELDEIAATDKGSSADMALVSALLKSRDFQNALEAIARLEKKLPDQPLAATLRGRTQLAQKDLPAARKSFEAALSKDPAYFPAAAGLAGIDIVERRPDDAKKRFEAVLKKSPDNSQALLALAKLGDVTGLPNDQVIALMDRAIGASPLALEPRLQLIDFALRNGDAGHALAAAQQAVAALPKSLELLEALGRAQQASGQVHQAIVSFTNLVTKEPNSVLAQRRLAGAHLANKDWRAAEQRLRKALAIQPNDLPAQRGLLLIAIEGKKLNDALAITRAVQRQRPKQAVGYAMEAEVHAGQKRWDAAEAAYRTGLQAELSSDLAIGLVSTLKSAGKRGVATQFAETWMKDYPRDVAFRIQLGDAALVERDYAGAESLYLASLKLQPDNAMVLNNLAWVMSRQRKNGALAYAEKAVKLAPNQAAFLDTLGALHAEQGKFADALRFQTRALELEPKNSLIRLNLAKTLAQSGDKLRAREELGELSKLGDSFPAQPEVAVLLRSL